MTVASGVVLLSTFFANTVDLEGVAGSDIVILAPDLLLNISHFFCEKLHRTAALGANHVMVTAPVVLVFKPGDSVMKCNFAGQTALRQQFQRAIHGGVADAGIFFLDQPVQFIRGKMISRF